MSETVGHTTQQLTAVQTALAGRYAILRELGRGGMATVHLAEDLQHERKVAVKLLLPELGASIGSDRFLREIEVGTLLQHPNIVGVLDSGEAAGQLYYVMPFVEGKSLRDRLDAQPQMPIDEAIDIVRQMAEALDYAHARGVIHRDIKPENILLDGQRALLADFGIARAVTLAGGETLTQTGMTVGTPTYMSPEQALGSKDVTPESDIYSLACVLYQMLAGQPPFTGPTAMALLARHSLDNVPSLKIVRNTIPDAVEDAIIKAMSKVPADRFHTAGAFVAALTDDDGAAARRQNSLRAKERAAKAAAAPTRRRALLSAAVAVPLLAVSLFAGSKLLGDAAPPPGLVGDNAHGNIAVMYFDRPDDGELAAVADGITESLIRELSAVEQLKVISRNGVRPYRGTDVTPDSLARALKVGTLVTGSVAQVGTELRVDLELVDALTGNVIDSREVRQPRDQVVALQDSLALELSDFLRRRVGGQIERLASRVGTKNSGAWEAMQRAAQTARNVEPLLAGGNLDAALRTYAAADSEYAIVEGLDGAWVDPIVQRGWLAYQQARLLLRGDKERVPALLDAARGHAERALVKAPQDADALELRGTVRYWSWLNNLAPNPDAAAQLLAGAEADFKASTVANKLQASAWNSLSHLLFNKNRTAEGKLAADAAYRADPYLTAVDLTIARLFGASLDLNQPTEAQKWCSEGRRRFPENHRFTQCQLQLHMLKASTPPKVDELWALYDSMVRTSAPPIQEFNKLKGKMFVALGLLRADLKDSALAVARSARGSPAIDPAGELQYLESIVLAQAGESDAAIRLLTRFIAANPQQREYWKHDETWWFDDIRDDPRFKALVDGA